MATQSSWVTACPQYQYSWCTNQAEQECKLALNWHLLRSVTLNSAKAPQYASRTQQRKGLRIHHLSTLYMFYEFVAGLISGQQQQYLGHVHSALVGEVEEDVVSLDCTVHIMLGADVKACT